MAAKFYTILISGGTKPVPYEAVQDALVADDWLRVTANQFFACTVRAPREIWESVMKVIGADHFVIVIEVVATNGWVNDQPKVVTEWFRKPRP